MRCNKPDSNTSIRSEDKYSNLNDFHLDYVPVGNTALLIILYIFISMQADSLSGMEQQINQVRNRLRKLQKKNEKEKLSIMQSKAMKQ